MMPSAKLFSLLIAVIVLSGCARVQSNIQVFHELGDDYAGKRIAVLPWDSEKEGSLEFRAYAGMLGTYLKNEGFNVVPPEHEPEWVAFFDYGIDGGRTVTSTYSVPQWGQTGVSSATTYGTLNTFGNTGYYSGTTTYTPTYGITGYSTGITSATVFTRFVNIDIVDVSKSTEDNTKKIYEIRLTSRGSCGNITQVMDEFLQSIFQDFPGESGRGGKITVPAKFDC